MCTWHPGISILLHKAKSPPDPSHLIVAEKDPGGLKIQVHQAQRGWAGVEGGVRLKTRDKNENLCWSVRSWCHSPVQCSPGRILLWTNGSVLRQRSLRSGKYGRGWCLHTNQVCCLVALQRWTSSTKAQKALCALLVSFFDLNRKPRVIRQL